MMATGLHVPRMMAKDVYLFGIKKRHITGNMIYALTDRIIMNKIAYMGIKHGKNYNTKN